MKKLTYKQIVLFAFIALQLVLYFVLNFAKLNNSHYLSYGIVCLCLVFAIVYIFLDCHSYFAILAFIFTLIADYFLVLKGGEHKTLAMCFFMCAQIMYGAIVYLYAPYPKERIAQILTRIIISIIAIILAFIILKDKVQTLFIISVVYYFNMLISIVFAFYHFKKDLAIKLLAIGLVLFSLCDISIGLTFLVDIFSLGQNNIICKILNLPINYVNIFYPISQIVIACSVMIKKLNK